MRNIIIGIVGVVLLGVAACTSNGGGVVTAPSPVTTTPSVVGTKPPEAPCNGCSFTAAPQASQIRLTWSGLFKGSKASCVIETSPNIGTYNPSACDEGTMLVPMPLAPTTYTLTVTKNEGNDAPQVITSYVHGPFGTFAGPTTASTGHSGYLTVTFGAINGDVHSITANWTSQVPRDDDPGIVYEGVAVGPDASLSVNATSATRCGGTSGPQATFNGVFTVVDATHITGTYTGSACSAASGTYSLTKQ